MTDTTLSTDELAALLNITGRQLRKVTEHGDQARARTFSSELVRRLQVASSLVHQIPSSGSRNTPFPVIARAVLDYRDDPEPRTWAILKDGAICYVHYSADLARFVGDGGVVAKIDKLWPDVPAIKE